VKKVRNKKSRKRNASPVESPEVNEDDEGFSSDSYNPGSNNNVLYDPYQRGCQRPGLRVRRYAKPWWISNANAENYGIVFQTTTMKEHKAEQKLKLKMYEDGVTEKQFLQSTLDCWITPSEKLKMLKKAKPVSLKSSKTSNRRKLAASKKPKAFPSEVESVGAVSSTSSSTVVDSFASLLEMFSGGRPNSEPTTPSIQCNEYGKNYLFSIFPILIILNFSRHGKCKGHPISRLRKRFVLWLLHRKQKRWNHKTHTWRMQAKGAF
jgi:hypothetical protein